jgi:ATP-dependent RNA helicase DeaD
LKIRRETIPSLDQVEEARANVFFEKLRAALDAKQFTSHDRMIDRLLDQGYASTDICSALIHQLQGGPSAKKSAPGKRAVSAAEEADRRPKAPYGGPRPHAAGKKAGREASAAPAAPPGDGFGPRAEEADGDSGSRPDNAGPRRSKYRAAPRTGQEPGMVAVFFNVGRKHLVTPADIVGKLTGVTRLTGEVIGAIDIHQRHTLVDVAEEHALQIVKKLTGIELKGAILAPALVGKGEPAES